MSLFESVGPPYVYVMPHASKLALPREGRRLSYMAICQEQDKTSAPWIFPFCNIPILHLNKGLLEFPKHYWWWWCVNCFWLLKTSSANNILCVRTCVTEYWLYYAQFVTFSIQRPDKMFDILKVLSKRGSEVSFLCLCLFIRGHF